MLQILNKVRELITNHIFIYVTCKSFLEELTDRTETIPYSDIYLSGVCSIELICVDIVFEVTPRYATPITKRVHPLDNTLERREEH